jgi:hypothetical protein
MPPVTAAWTQSTRLLLLLMRFSLAGRCHSERSAMTARMSLDRQRLPHRMPLQRLPHRMPLCPAPQQRLQQRRVQQVQQQRCRAAPGAAWRKGAAWPRQSQRSWSCGSLRWRGANLPAGCYAGPTLLQNQPPLNLNSRAVCSESRFWTYVGVNVKCIVQNKFLKSEARQLLIDLLLPDLCWLLVERL